MRVFEAAARHASFTNAAEELHVTHGAVSQQVKVLEDYFQRPLFLRSKGKVALNSAGEMLLPVISEVLDRVEQVSARLRGESDQEILTIHLTAAFAGRWLIPRLSDFQQRYPNITIRLSPSTSFSGFQDMELDVAIRWGRHNTADVAMEKLFDIDTFAACAPALLHGKHPLKTLDDLKFHPLIHDDDGEAWRALSGKANLAQLGHSKDLFYSDTLLALQAAVEGQGVIAAGSVIAAQDLAAGKLVIPFRHFVRRRNAYYLYYPERFRQRDKIRVFRQWLQEQTSTYLDEVVDLETYVN